MQNIEPFYNWRDEYIASEDTASPFYGREYSEFEYSNTIYNYYVHPQWDNIGSPTLYIKILYADYEKGLAIIELIGEWNDTINNDIMLLKREILDQLLFNNIHHYILIGENVLNFHGSDDCYYEELANDNENGWVCLLNFREHVIKEMNQYKIDRYLLCNGKMTNINWRIYKPIDLYELVKGLISNEKGISQSATNELAP